MCIRSKIKLVPKTSDGLEFFVDVAEKKEGLTKFRPIRFSSNWCK